MTTDLPQILYGYRDVLLTLRSKIEGLTDPTVMIPELDDQGHPVLDTDGNPVMIPNPHPYCLMLN